MSERSIWSTLRIGLGCIPKIYGKQACGHSFSYGWQNNYVTTTLTDEERGSRLSALTALIDLMRPSVQADGGTVTTIEGLADGDILHPMQRGFQENHGLQCG